MRLSILICTIRSRQLLCGRLLGMLRRQRLGLSSQAALEVEVLIDEDAGEATIGEKRNRLLGRAGGKHVCFIDDDDTVSGDYISELLRALETDPDCVGFRAGWHVDGKPVGTASYTIQNQSRREISLPGDLLRIERQPGHLTPVRATLARATGFEPWCYGEDADYSIRLRPLLKTEVFIDAVLYDYWLINREARGCETVHPNRWCDDNFRIERSYSRARQKPEGAGHPGFGPGGSPDL